jgi:DNA-binding response OmpR family regulator
VVLLAEDDELIASVVSHRLSREGYDVRHCADGAAALAAAAESRADLAVLDVKMPAMDGFELLARLRALPAWADVPVLFLTSLGGEQDLVRAFDLGANDYVLKPFSPAELVARVRRLLSD